MQIILQSVLFKPRKKNIISILEKVLSEELDASIGTAPQIKEIPVQLFDKQRTQKWKSNDILQWLSDMYKPSKSTKILAICDFDAYSGHLNFVFGEAIYLPRLRQEFYGLKPDGSLFYQRLVKETVHELGHAFGLNHCKNKRCVMHFSNSLSDTDIKASHFCNVCKGLLEISLFKFMHMQQDFKYVVPKISNVQYTFYNLMHLSYLDQLLIVPICL